MTSSIMIGDMNTNDLEWLKTSEEKQKEKRKAYLDSFVKPLPTYCPECGEQLTTTEDEDETICTKCGLITSASIEYVGVKKIVLPYGRH